MTPEEIDVFQGGLSAIRQVGERVNELLVQAQLLLGQAETALKALDEYTNRNAAGTETNKS